MAVAIYRGFNLQSADNSTDTWQVTIKNHLLTGNLAAVKKSIDWFCDTASIINPKEFESIGQRRELVSGVQEQFHGFTIKNDTGEANQWYCFFNGRLIKGSKIAIQKHIEAYLVAKQQAAQQATQKR
ncbi:MAG: DUF3319 domain-containing protein [Vibrio sp.]